MTEEEIKALQDKVAGYETTFELAKAGFQRLGVETDLTKLGKEVKLDDFTSLIENSLQSRILSSEKLAEFEQIKALSENSTKKGINSARLAVLKAINGELLDESVTKQYWLDAVEENPKDADTLFYKKIAADLKKKASMTDSEIKQKMSIYERDIAEQKNKLTEYEKFIRDRDLALEKYEKEVIPNIQNEKKAFLEQSKIEEKAFREFLSVPIVPITKAQTEEQRDAAIEAFFGTLQNSVLRKYTIEKTAAGEIVFYNKNKELQYKEGTAVHKKFKDLFEEEAKLLGLYDYSSKDSGKNSGAGDDDKSSNSQAKIDKRNRLDSMSKV